MSEGLELMELVRGEWYEPIIRRVEAFENESEVFQEIGSVAKTDSAEWAFECAMKAMRPFGELAGIPFDGTFDAKDVGAIVGSKASICRAMSDNHRAAQKWTAIDRKKFADIWGSEATKYAEATWKRFAEELHPEFEAVRKFALNLSMKQSYLEDLQFQTGVVKGMTFMLEVRKTIRKAVTKAERDTQKRMAVYLFAVCGWEAIEGRRTELSWPELSEGFNQAFDHQIEMDEDAFKKILQRCGLRVGKPGRKISVR